MHCAAPAASRVIGVAVHVPFDVRNAILGHEIGDLAKQIVEDFGFRQVERELPTKRNCLHALGLQNPIRMRAIQVAVWVHHLRFEPKTKFHAEGFYSIYD